MGHGGVARQEDVDTARVSVARSPATGTGAAGMADHERPPRFPEE